MSKLWQPSNGDEGMYAEEICARCKRDDAFRSGEGDSCPIIANLYAAKNINDPIFPKEWIYGEDGWPTCTAFEEIDQPDKQDLNAAIRDLFDGAA